MPKESDPLHSLIADILEAEISGDPVDREALISQHPDQADSLREFFANHDSMKEGSDKEDVTVALPDSSPVEDASLPHKLGLSEEPTLPPSKVAYGEEATLAGQAIASVDPATVGDKVRYFGDYELLEEIARGGMGVVYRAQQVNLNRIVALKMILSGQLAGDEDVKRFYTEAEAAANLDHPGIVPIFEVGQHQGQHYFSMGYIEGQSLAQKVADGPLPPREAAELVQKICEAMAYAHERGVIHRDLKPANILLDQNGQPKVTDFGLAKKMNVDSGLTGTGQILGTPSYMAPEQASGKVDEVGPLADVYALGAILYCLLTGRPPFQAANPMDTLLQVLDKEPIAPRQLNATVPVDLETISLKALNKEPSKRYGSANDLKTEIGRFLAREPILARPVSRLERTWRWSRRNPALASLTTVAVFLFLGLGIVAYEWDRSSDEETQRSIYQARIRSAHDAWKSGNVDFMLNELRDLSSPSTAHMRGWEWYYLLSLAHQHTRSIRLGWNVENLVWSPDGSQLMIAGDSLERATGALIDPNTGSLVSYLNWNAVPNTDTRKGSGQLAWSNDGRWVGRCNGSVVEICDAGTGAKILEMVGADFCWGGGSKLTVLAADSRSIAVSEIVNGEFQETNLKDASVGNEKLLAIDQSSTGYRIATHSERGETVLWANSPLEIVHRFEELHTVSLLRWSPNESKLASVGMGGQIHIWDVADTPKLSRVIACDGEISDLDWHAGSALIAAACGNQRMRIWDIESGDELTAVCVDEITQVSWSPAGEKIATIGDNTIKIWETDKLPKDAKRLPSMFRFAWGPDQSIASIPSQLNLHNVAIYDPLTAKVKTLTNRHGFFDVAWSFDGSRIAALRNNPSTIYSWDAPKFERETAMNIRINAGSIAFKRNGGLVLLSPDAKQAWEYEFDNDRPNPVDVSKVKSLFYSNEGSSSVHSRYVRILEEQRKLASPLGVCDDEHDGRILLTLESPDSEYHWGPRWSRDGTMLAVCGTKSSFIWDASVGYRIGKIFNLESMRSPNRYMPHYRWRDRDLRLLSELLTSPSPTVCDATMNLLCKDFGPAFLSYFRRNLDEISIDAGRKLALVCERQPLVKINEFAELAGHDDPSIRLHVAKTLLNAVNQIDGDLALTRARALAITTFGELLHQEDRYAVPAARCLRHLGPDSIAVVKELQLALEHQSPAVRIESASALSNLGELSDSVTGALQEGLQSRSPDILRTAMNTMLFCPLADAQVDSTRLRELMKDNDFSIRWLAGQLLTAMESGLGASTTGE